jgi:deoxyribodipyrimidine photo-lyase
VTAYHVEAGSTAIVWFRRDLRLADHPALSAAARGARRVVPLFVLDHRLLDASAPARAWYLRGSLVELDVALRRLGSRLVVRVGRAEDVVPSVAREAQADVVLASRDVTSFGHRRDRAVSEALARDGRRLALRPGLLLVEPEQLLTEAGRPYRVFTPFWRALQGAERRTVLPAPATIPPPPESIRDSTRLAREPAPWPGLPATGEGAARERLETWLARGLGGYAARRDDLDGLGTSRLGPDLHLGTLSPRQVEAAAVDSGSDPTAFVRQLAWRELYHHQLFHQRQEPDTLASPLMRAFRTEADDPSAVEAWRAGRTGIPTVDAAMRQLAATGWMSNRARLVTASFLTRHLLMDYRIGERHFMHHLIDGDVANNRGGWQWVAGVGLDAQPWFRIFNPVRQGQRFDPAGAWVRRWIPELGDVEDRFVHAPWEAPSPPSDYPSPIVGLAEGRDRALAAFEDATASTS